MKASWKDRFFTSTRGKGLKDLRKHLFSDGNSVDLIEPLGGVFGIVTINGVQNNSTVPEPTSALVIGVAGCLSMFWRRRMKRFQNETLEAF